MGCDLPAWSFFGSRDARFRNRRKFFEKPFATYFGCFVGDKYSPIAVQNFLMDRGTMAAYWYGDVPEVRSVNAPVSADVRP